MFARHRSAGVAVAVTVAALLGAGCGDDEQNSEQTAAAAGSGSDVAKLAKTEVDKLIGPKGTYGKPPDAAPKPESGKDVWLISCSQAVTACSGGIKGASDAAKAIGWRSHVFDAKYDLPGAQTGIRQALAAGADGIFVYYIDCKYIRSALEEANEAKVPVVAAESIDCDESDPGAPSLFTGEVTYEDGTFLEWTAKWGEAQAQYAIANTDGKANMVVFTDESLGSNNVVEAQQKVFAECGECEYTPVKFPIASLGSKFQGIASQALLRNAEANVVAATYEAVMLSGGVAAVEQTGRDPLVDIGEGTAAGMDLIRSGKADYGAGLAVEWEGWSGIDGMVRLFAGEEPVNSGIGQQLFDKEHNVRESGGFEPPTDFRSGYRAAWGVG